MRPGPNDQGFGIGNQGSEVRHCAQSQKNDAGDDFPLDPVFIKSPDQIRRSLLCIAHQRREREIDNENSKSNRKQQERLIILCNGKVKKDKTDADHQNIAARQIGDSGLGE